MADVPTIAGLSGFGGRPRLHPSWREPDHEPGDGRAEAAPVLVFRLERRRT